jgi:DNA invertase Pin-like site-specific DNA recombinase
MRIGGYIRVSVVGGRAGERFMSPDLQRERIQGWCASHGHELVDVHEDLDVSGAQRDRPNLIDLIQRIERGELDGLVVAKLDRFARNITHALELLDRIRQADGHFASVADSFDTSTAYGRLALNVMLAFGQFEVERYSEQWVESKARMIEQGRHHGPTPPLGYDRTDGKLTPNEHAPLVRQIFERRANGESVTVLAAMLNDHGIETGRGGRPRAQYVASIVRCRTYLGEVRAGDDLVNPDAHEPLVDQLTFARANTAQATRPSRGDAPAILSGLVRCSACRYVMNAAKTPYADGYRRAYRCRRDHTAGRCPRPAMAVESVLLPLVEQQFFAQLGDMHARASGDLAAARELKDARNDARHALIVYRDDPDILTALAPSEYAEGLKVRSATVRTAQAALDRHYATRPAGDIPDAASLRLAWPEMDNDTRRRMFRATFDCVAVSAPKVHRSHSEPLAGRISFLPVGLLPDDIPTPGRKPTELRAFDIINDPGGPWMPPSQPLPEDARDTDAGIQS